MLVFTHAYHCRHLWVLRKKASQNTFKCWDYKIYLPALWLTVDQRMLKLIVLHTRIYQLEYSWWKKTQTRSQSNNVVDQVLHNCSIPWSQHIIFVLVVNVSQSTPRYLLIKCKVIISTLILLHIICITRAPKLRPCKTTKRISLGRYKSQIFQHL